MKTNLTYHGHSCFSIDNGYFSLVIDPFKNGSVPNLKIEKKIKANLLLCSHNHDDHHGIENVELKDSSYRINVKTVNSYHDKNSGLSRGNNIIHVIFIGNLKIVHLGDLGYIHSIEDMDSIKNCDVLLAPINGFYTVGSYEIFDLMTDSLMEEVMTSKCKLISAELIKREEGQDGYSVKMDGQPLGIIKVLAQVVINISNNSEIPVPVLLALLAKTAKFFQENPESVATVNVSEELGTLEKILNRGE